MPNNTLDPHLTAGYEACRRIMQQSGKSYYFATSLFSDVWMKRSTWALYAFFRIPDDIVDEQPNKTPEQLTVELEAFAQEWRDAFAQERVTDPKMAAIIDTFNRTQIPHEEAESFLRSMAMDVQKKRYATYAELEEYMYGSAGVVGFMMARVIGFSDPRALEHAKVLGYAMQLTNFLRDIDADYRELGRVYMPLEELAAYGLSEQDIAARRWSPQFHKFMQFQIQRAEELYAEGNKCLPLLSAEGRFAYQMASVLYGRILAKLQQQDCNPFAGRASTSLAEKMWLLVKTKIIG